MATSDVGSDKGPGPGVVAQSRGRPARGRERALKSTSTFQTVQLQGSERTVNEKKTNIVAKCLKVTVSDAAGRGGPRQRRVVDGA